MTAFIDASLLFSSISFYSQPSTARSVSLFRRSPLLTEPAPITAYLPSSIISKQLILAIRPNQYQPIPAPPSLLLPLSSATRCHHLLRQCTSPSRHLSNTPASMTLTPTGSPNSALIRNSSEAGVSWSVVLIQLDDVISLNLRTGGFIQLWLTLAPSRLPRLHLCLCLCCFPSAKFWCLLFHHQVSLRDTVINAHSLSVLSRFGVY